ncbi:histone-lysine N-methyltransferase MLL3 [Clonorchis sinensis]|uniref:Histone-lysine N-methyltransferase MLL3 n=1 Tax=Clonorchis sinensis TaxID=79923 RepID=G7YD21_CLOSI|nr:histone-lysine N-methyltransferase MLL3 [Clonorchis sinensis]
MQQIWLPKFGDSCSSRHFAVRNRRLFFSTIKLNRQLVDCSRTHNRHSYSVTNEISVSRRSTGKRMVESALVFSVNLLRCRSALGVIWTYPERQMLSTTMFGQNDVPIWIPYPSSPGPIVISSVALLLTPGLTPVSETAVHRQLAPVQSTDDVDIMQATRTRSFLVSALNCKNLHNLHLIVQRLVVMLIIMITTETNCTSAECVSTLKPNYAEATDQSGWTLTAAVVYVQSEKDLSEFIGQKPSHFTVTSRDGVPYFSRAMQVPNSALRVCIQQTGVQRVLTHVVMHGQQVVQQQQQHLHAYPSDYVGIHGTRQVSFVKSHRPGSVQPSQPSDGVLRFATITEEAVPSPPTESHLLSMLNPRRRINYHKWEEDEHLGNQSTIAPVLHANVLHPTLQGRVPEFTARAKEITKLWRRLLSEERGSWVSQARNNRTNLRGGWTYESIAYSDQDLSLSSLIQYRKTHFSYRYERRLDRPDLPTPIHKSSGVLLKTRKSGIPIYNSKCAAPKRPKKGETSRGLPKFSATLNAFAKANLRPINRQLPPCSSFIQQLPGHLYRLGRNKFLSNRKIRKQRLFYKRYKVSLAVKRLSSDGFKPLVKPKIKNKNHLRMLKHTRIALPCVEILVARVRLTVADHVAVDLFAEIGDYFPSPAVETLSVRRKHDGSLIRYCSYGHFYKPLCLVAETKLRGSKIRILQIADCCASFVRFTGVDGAKPTYQRGAPFHILRVSFEAAYAPPKAKYVKCAKNFSHAPFSFGLTVQADLQSYQSPRQVICGHPDPVRGSMCCISADPAIVNDGCIYYVDFTPRFVESIADPTHTECKMYAVWWTQNAKELEEALKASNARRLFQLILATGPRKSPVSETIKDLKGVSKSTTCRKMLVKLQANDGDKCLHKLRMAYTKVCQKRTTGWKLKSHEFFGYEDEIEDSCIPSLGPPASQSKPGDSVLHDSRMQYPERMLKVVGDCYHVFIICVENLKDIKILRLEIDNLNHEACNQLHFQTIRLLRLIGGLPKTCLTRRMFVCGLGALGSANPMFQLNSNCTNFDEYTHSHTESVFTEDSPDPPLNLSFQLNVLHKGPFMFQLSWIVKVDALRPVCFDICTMDKKETHNHITDRTMERDRRSNRFQGSTNQRRICATELTIK